jgi:hypothetical protein
MKTQENARSAGPEFDFLRPPISLTVFVRQMGIKPITAWRWRRAGKLRTINICGRLYVPAEEIANFNQRAGTGEFEKKHRTPSPQGQGTATRVKRGRPVAAVRRAAA